MIEDGIERYSEFVAKHPAKFLAGVVLVTVLLVSGATKVETVEQSTEDFLPDSFPSIRAFDTIQAEFSSAEATTYTILVESSPDYGGSNEIRDMRDPEALRYMSLIESEARSMERVSSVASAADLFSEIPSTKRAVKQTMKELGEGRWSQHISEDYSAARIRVKASGLSADQEVELAKDLRYNVESNPTPPGLELAYTGQTYIDEAFQDASRNTNQTTSTVAFILVLVVVIVLFRSIYYGLTSLQTLVFGIAAGFGVFGHLGLNLSPATSGAISIGVGIAIDFGIQPVSRYREERRNQAIEEALSTTLKGVYRPMTLGVVAAIMGFSSLSLGRITFLSSLGTMLSLTTFMAYLAAFTVIPSTMIIHDRYVSGLLSEPGLKQYFREILPE